MMQLPVLKIELNEDEYNYLCKASFLEDKYRGLLFSSARCNNNYMLIISEDAADEIRDLCGEQLQVAGFNEVYELTAEGEILENLIDKFFIG
ncbi:MAG: hypothetical protein JSR80_04755 [Verrucomicrobia bacterium]|nr:hypothetical protein [Verrucomicrobiota bacterium]